MDPRFAEMTAALQLYFDGLYHCDTGILAKVFHPEAHYFNAVEGTLMHLDMGQYFPVVEKRVSPASKGEARADRIISIEFAGPVTAFARVECVIRPRFFTDLLTFVFLDGRWQIVAKVFHYDLRE